MKFLLALVLLFHTNEAAKPAPEDWHQDLRKATFALYERHWDKVSKEFVSRFQCSAIAVKRTQDGGYFLLTAGHCFPDKEDSDSKYYVSEDSAEDPTLQSVEIKKRAHTKKFDYTILYLESGRDYPTFSVDYGDLPPADTPVVNVNFSFGLTKQTATGFVASGILKSDEGNRCTECRGRFVASLGIGPGASGSAIVDEKTHKVIGLVEGVFEGFAIGTIAVPMGKTFDDFLVDGSVMEKAPPEPPKKPEPPQPKPNFWHRVWNWIKHFFVHEFSSKTFVIDLDK